MTPRTRLKPRPLAAAAKIGVFILALIILNQAVHALTEHLSFDIRPNNEDTVHRVIMALAVLYTFTLALPFVPGIEIALALIAIIGPKIVFLLYVCTVAGMLVAFGFGRLIPARILVRLAQDLGMRKVAILIAASEQLDPEERLARLLASARGPVGTFLLRNRYVALAVAVNVPGNFLVGGGGGISLLAGLSRVFSPPAFALTMAVAVSPVPLAVHFWGPAILGH